MNANKRMIDMIAARVCLIGAGLLLSACASTKLVNVWQDPNYTGPPFKNILVMGVTENPGERRTFEDVFSAELKLRGITAVPSYTRVPKAGQIERTKLATLITETGIDGILTTRLVKVKTETRYTPGYTTTYPAVGYYGGFYDYYDSAYVGPSTIQQYNVVTLETNIFEVKAQNLVWSGTTETFAPGKLEKESARFAQLIIKALAERKLIQP